MSPTLYPPSSAPSLAAGAVSSGLKILAQTLPELKVPTVTDKEEDSVEAQYNGGIVNGNDELATVAPSPKVTSILADVINMCLGFDNCTANETEVSGKNCTINCAEDDPVHTERNYWTLLLLLFPVFTVFGNILVLMSVYKERSLQTVTNYFIVSLAVADLLLASIVMPFAVYYLVGASSFSHSALLPSTYSFTEQRERRTVEISSISARANRTHFWSCS